MKIKMILTISLLVLCGCGLTGSKGVSKEQLNADIGRKSLTSADGKSWNFPGDMERCFAVMDDQTKITAANADVMVTVGSWRDISIGNSNLYNTVYGKLRMLYKMDGGKWVLEKIEPVELIDKTLETEEFKKFVDIQMPLCKYYRFTNHDQ